MEKDEVGVVEFPYYNSVKVHRSICLQLIKLLHRIGQIFAAIESVRPRSKNGIPALCLLQVSVDKAKSLIQHCSESSKIYLAIAGEKILSRCERICNNLESCLSQIQNMVPLQLAVKISGIIQDLLNTNFCLDADDREAGKIIISLMHRDIKLENEKVVEDLQLAALKLKITSPVAVLLERRCIRKLLVKIDDTSPTKKKLLKYLLYLLKKYGDGIWQCKSRDTTVNQPEETPPSFMNDCDSPEPPEEFKCPISTRLMYDPSIIASGLTFERVWIERWFDEGNNKCPVTHSKLEHFSVTPNSAMKSLIDKWCSKHKVSISNPCLESSLSLRSSSSAISVASFGSEMDDLSLGVSSFSINSSNISGYSDLSGDDDSHGKTSSLLNSLADLSWESQCKVVEHAKLEFASNAQAQISSTSFYALIKFTKEASRFSDVKAQRNGLEVLLSMLSHNRNELPCFQGDAVHLFASYLDSEFTGTALAILEILSYEQHCLSMMLAFGVLPSLLKILETPDTEFHSLSMKILANLSINSDIGHHMLYLDYIPTLVRFLSDGDLARFSSEIVKNLCRTEEARIALCENSNSVMAIGKLLESTDEQEHALEILLLLCHSGEDFCNVVMTESIVESLVDITANGGARARSIALELLQLLGHNGARNASGPCNDIPRHPKPRKPPPSTTLRLLGRVSRFAKSR